MGIFIGIIIGIFVLFLIIGAIASSSEEKNKSQDKTIYRKPKPSYKPRPTIKSQALINHEKEVQGRVRQQYVHERLKSICKKYGGHIFYSFCFKDRSGYSSEIDHIIINRSGLYVIETKSNKGRLYGLANSPKWKIYAPNGQYSNEIDNPLTQNQGHINHLKRMLNRNIKIKSLIIFSDADISKIDIPNVFNIDEDEKKLEELLSQNNYSDNFVNEVNNKLNEIKTYYGIEISEHIRNVSERYGDRR